MSNTFFQCGGGILGGYSPYPYSPWLRSWGKVVTARPLTRLAQVRSWLPLPAEAGCETC